GAVLWFPVHITVHLEHLPDDLKLSSTRESIGMAELFLPQSFPGFDSNVLTTTRRSRLLIGAPRAQTSQPGVQKGGAVFRCRTDRLNSCQEVPFDDSDVITAGKLTDIDQTESREFRKLVVTHRRIPNIQHHYRPVFPQFSLRQAFFHLVRKCLSMTHRWQHKAPPPKSLRFVKTGADAWLNFQETIYDGIRQLTWTQRTNQISGLVQLYGVPEKMELS
ncbi:hypothetical protein BaRGS_00030788, partial [Batillaria attramentaria]